MTDMVDEVCEFVRPQRRLVRIAREEAVTSTRAGWPVVTNVAKYMGAEYAPGCNWCAGFVSWCLENAGFEAPMHGRPRRGARALVDWVAKSGRWCIHPRRCRDIISGELALPPADVVRPGDVIAWKRGRLPWVWKAHVALVAEYEPRSGRMVVVEGNVGGRVRATVLSAREWPVRMRGLYGIARPRVVA